jgi:CRISPR system Cascade subunit CasD
MSTLLLRLAAPLQSWGSDSKFNRRLTEREPTKSGVIGLLAAALGRGRADDVSDLAALKFGVRIEQPGELVQDFHTARRDDLAFVTKRYYLADAVFLAGVESDDAFLGILDAAVRAPVFPLYLGRRSCPPAAGISLGVRNKPLWEALRDEDWQASAWYQGKIKKQLRREQEQVNKVNLTFVCDAQQPGALFRRDLPLSFSQERREYAFRGIDDKVDAVNINYPILPGEHDPLAELEEQADVLIKD